MTSAERATSGRRASDKGATSERRASNGRAPDVDDGRLLTGLVVNETPDHVEIVQNLLRPENIERIQKSAIEERKVADVSSMPSGLLDTFTAEDILDLLAFVESSKAIPATNQ